MPPSSGNRDESSLITSAPGTKNNSAARTQRLIDDVPLCPAAAIQRGPSTAAILNSSTSQKPIDLRSCDFSSRTGGAGMVMESPGFADEMKSVSGNHNERQLPATSSKPQRAVREIYINIGRHSERTGPQTFFGAPKSDLCSLGSGLGVVSRRICFSPFAFLVRNSESWKLAANGCLFSLRALPMLSAPEQRNADIPMQPELPASIL